MSTLIAFASCAADSGAPSTTACGIADWLALCDDGDRLLARLEVARGVAVRAADTHIWIHLCPAAAWSAQLNQLRQRLAESSTGATARQRWPLLGVPFAVKDNIDIAGEPTTAACPAFTYTAERHATAVYKLLDAGAVWVGKTNLDQFATGLVGTRSPYGRPVSVADPLRVSGGSSSGSAVAVALGIVPFALGTDTAGSGRIPAAFNGIVGLKPTPGRVGSAGVLPACRTLDCVSVLAASVDDAAHVLALIEGPDPADFRSRFEPGPARLPQTLRIGIPKAPVLDAAIGYPTAWQAQLQAQSDAGHALVEIDFGLLEAVGSWMYQGPWVAERHVAIREFFDTQPEALDANVRHVIGNAANHSATDTFAALYLLQQTQAQLAALWQQVDVLLVPSAPTHPLTAAVDADPIAINAQLGRYTNFVNLLGWCALAVPAGNTANGLPFGVTWIARGGHDAALVQLLGSATPVLKRPAAQAALTIAVVGAHLSGLPLNGQLTERGATLIEATTTAARYRLYALPGTQPPKPGLRRCAADERGSAIAVELWSMPMRAVGSFVALIPAPLGLGSIEMADGRSVQGFLCEAHALHGAIDISEHGGWRAYLARSADAPSNP